MGGDRWSGSRDSAFSLRGTHGRGSLTSLFANQPANRRTEAQVVIVGKTSKELVVRFLEPEMQLLHGGSKGSRLRQCLGDSVVEERQRDAMGAGSWLPRPR